MKKRTGKQIIKYGLITIMLIVATVILSSCSGNDDKNSLHINHTNDIYGSDEYLDTSILVAGNIIPEEEHYTVRELEKMVAEDDNLMYNGDYSLMSSGGAFSIHRFTGLRLYEFLKECGIDENVSDDTEIKFVSVDGFAHTIKWGEIKNSEDNVYGAKGDTSPKLKNVPKILAFASNGVPLVGPVGTTELGHKFVKEDGFDENAENVGGPVRLVFGQKSSEDSNAPKNIQWLRQIIVGDDDYSEAHEYMLQKEQEYRSNKSIVVDESSGEWTHKNEPYSAFLSCELKVYGSETKGENVYTLAEIEGKTESTVTDTFGASCGVNAYRGILLKDIVSENLKDGTRKPTKVSIVASDGYETEINVDDIQNGIESKYQTGETRDIIIAYAINGKPLVRGKNDDGFDGDNGTGPMQLVAENQVSKWVRDVAAVKIGD